VFLVRLSSIAGLLFQANFFLFFVGEAPFSQDSVVTFFADFGFLPLPTIFRRHSVCDRPPCPLRLSRLVVISSLIHPPLPPLRMTRGFFRPRARFPISRFASSSDTFGPSPFSPSQSRVLFRDQLCSDSLFFLHFPVGPFPVRWLLTTPCSSC